MEKENSKVKGFGVPQNIPELETIEQTNQKFLDAWVNYFKNLSPRIRIIFPKDEKFNFEKIKSSAALLKDLKNKDKDKMFWPENELAFMLCLDSNILTDKSVYLVKDTYLFYFDDLAFGLDHFDADYEILDEESSEPQYSYLGTYSLLNYSKDLLEWRFIAKLIKNKIKELEEMVPPPPENF